MPAYVLKREAETGYAGQHGDDQKESGEAVDPLAAEDAETAINRSQFPPD